MKFITVKLKDYGLYRGEIEFDLEPRQNGSKQKNVILFGGKNGAGKTTLLEAVKLCLYGKVSQGRISENNYRETQCICGATVENSYSNQHLFVGIKKQKNT